MHKIRDYVLVYLMWALVIALGIWLVLLSHNTFLSVFSALYVRDSITRAWQLRSLEKFYVIGVGLVCLIIMTVSEFYFRNGVRRGQLLPRFARILGLELLLLFMADAVLLAVQGLSIATWARWLILCGELGLGITCRIYARTSPTILSDFRTSDQDTTTFS